MLIMTQEKLDAVRHEFARTLERHGMNNAEAVSAMLCFGAALHAQLGGTAEAFVSTAEVAVRLAEKNNAREA